MASSTRSAAALLVLALCLFTASATRSLPGRSLLASGPNVNVLPTFQYGADMGGNDLAHVDNVASGPACGALCASTPGCKAFVYIAFDGQVINGGAVAGRCYLKSAAASLSNLDGAVAGQIDQKALGTAVTTLNLGQDLPGNDMMQMSLPTVRDCANFCAATNACQAFTYVDQSDTANNAGAVANLCYLKNAAGTPSAYSAVTSGVFNGNNTASATYYPMTQVVVHSADDPDSKAVPLAGRFLPQGQQDPNNPGLPPTTPIHVQLVYLLKPFSYGNIQQVDWYIHKPSTIFTDAANPPLASFHTATAAPFYLGTTANTAGGQGTTFDIQNFRSDGAQQCGSPAAQTGGKCTITAVATLASGTKVIAARSTFFVSVIASS